METKCCGQLRDTRFCPSCGRWLYNNTTFVVGGPEGRDRIAKVEIVDDDGDFSVFVSDVETKTPERGKWARPWNVNLYIGIEKGKVRDDELTLTVSAMNDVESNAGKSLKLVDAMPIAFKVLREQLDEQNRQ